jgi:hypothetical protein
VQAAARGKESFILQFHLMPTGEDGLRGKLTADS